MARFTWKLVRSRPGSAGSAQKTLDCIDDQERLEHDAQVEHMPHSGDRNLAGRRDCDQLQRCMVLLEMHFGKDAKKEYSRRAKLNDSPSVNMTVRDVEKHRAAA
jgi:hypothetical protein